MRNYSLLMILAGLAVGLFLGFNPTTHRDLARWWTTTAASQRQTQRTPAAISLKQFDNSVARLFRTSPKPQATVGSQPATAHLWSQIVAALQTLWHELQRIWLSIVAKSAASHN